MKHTGCLQPSNSMSVTMKLIKEERLIKRKIWPNNVLVKTRKELSDDQSVNTRVGQVMSSGQMWLDLQLNWLDGPNQQIQ